MTSDAKFYLSLFLRRLPWFLLVAAVAAAVSVIVAISLPPAYVSTMRLIVEAPQIPTELAPSTVRTPGLERLEIIEQRLLTRPNLLDIANRLNVLANQDNMNPDEIVEAMRARTTIRRRGGRDQATLMTVTFEARTPQLAARVLNQYLTQIQQDDVDYRKGRAGQTQDFFEQEVERLESALSANGERILEFKNANADALPDSLEFRQKQRASLQERTEQIARELFSLTTSRQQLVELFSETGQLSTDPNARLTPAEERLAEARTQLEEAQIYYTDSNPRVKMLQARVSELEEKAAAERAAVLERASDDTGPVPATPLDIRLAEIDGRVATLKDEEAALNRQIVKLTETIERTPANAIALTELERNYENIQDQFNQAVERLAEASTGERIEVLSRGERITVIEQPAVPSEPTKPNRVLIAGLGIGLGVGLGLGLVVLLEILRSAPRRPEDLIRKLDVWPLASLPYVRTRRELFFQRGLKLVLILIILVGVPAGVWAVHTYYQPLDLLADKVMNKMGVRW